MKMNSSRLRSGLSKEGRRRKLACRTGGVVVLAVLGALAVSLTIPPALAVSVELELDRRAPDRPLRAALFQASGFPTVDAPAIDPAVLDAALLGLPVDRLTSVEQLDDELRLLDYDVLILPYGSAFPLDAWATLRAFAERGGSLVVLGGAPFHQPVRREGDRFVLGVRQPTFAHELLIGPAEAVSRVEGEDAFGPLRTVSVASSAWSATFPEPSTVFELTVRLATRKNLPSEHGSEGYRDAVLRPLVHVVDGEGLPRACPLLEIDRLRGAAAGARWLLAPSDAPLDAPLVRRLVERALQGAAQLEARPVYASVEPGEVALIRVAQRRPFVRDGETVPDRAQLVVRDERDQEVFGIEVALGGQPESRHGEAEIRPAMPLHPGLYRVEVTTPGAPWQPRTTTTGFWVRDDELLAGAPPLTVSRDWLRRGGEVMPVNGTTYMASDVHRKFLFEPDPLTWDRDFARMAELGINFVRTGLWTAWSRAMLDPGAVDEGVLRALDAYVQTAARHDILVNFTFFAFRPPGYGAENPYLDPRALDGQRELLTLIARRFRDVHWVHWDLINEPSYAPAEALWTNRPIGDLNEERAWREWVAARHRQEGMEETNEALLRDRWQDPSQNVLALPEPFEEQYQAIREDRRPRKARDFNLFSQDMVTEWARTMRQILRDAGGDAVLVTLGQDEGGTYTRSSQQLHAEAVDYTGIHPWWRNDDVLASGVMAKVPEKPNLFQETGIMRLEDVDGWPWRSPEEAARTLERKYAYAFASRGAGSVEWAWNINPYQPIDNESVIGFFRPDGTAKPELRVVADLARFFDQAQPYLDDFEPEPVVAVIPHSRLLMGRPGGAEGLKRLVRLLAERFGVVPLGLSELRLSAERLAGARLVIVPSPFVLEDSAAEALLAASRAGTKILVTGVVTGNPYGELSAPLAELGLVGRDRPVQFRETTPWGSGDAWSWATFSGDEREQLRRSEAPAIETLNGDLWHEPLPLELAQEDGPLAGLLSAALEAAGVPTQSSDVPIATKLLYAPRSVLVVVVNETDSHASRRLEIAGRVVHIPVEAGRYRLAVFDRMSGSLVAATPGKTIEMDLGGSRP